MPGAGIQPAGATPAGYGAPVQAGPTPNVILPDPIIDGSQGSRLINAQTKDYVLDAGRILGMNNVQQLVLLAIANAAPALQNLEKLDSAFPNAVRAVLTKALAPLVAQGFIDIVSITTRMNAAGRLSPGQAATELKWRDRTTNEERSEAI